MQRLFDRTRSAAPGSDERKALLEQVSASMVRHSVTEKEHLYPVVRRFVVDGDTWADRELTKHREIEDTLHALEPQEPDSEEFGRLLLSLIERITEHVVEQEQLLFPRLQAMCPADQLNDLGVEARKTRALAPTRPRPAAPESASATKFIAQVTGPWDRLRDRLTGRGHQ